MSTPSKDSPKPPPANPTISGQSQITFTIGVGWMYMVVATSRPATTNTGGY